MYAVGPQSAAEAAKENKALEQSIRELEELRKETEEQAQAAGGDANSVKDHPDYTAGLLFNSVVRWVNNPSGVSQRVGNYATTLIVRLIQVLSLGYLATWDPERVAKTKDDLKNSNYGLVIQNVRLSSQYHRALRTIERYETVENELPDLEKRHARLVKDNSELGQIHRTYTQDGKNIRIRELEDVIDELKSKLSRKELSLFLSKIDARNQRERAHRAEWQNRK